MYVDFISDEHFLRCIANLHKTYLETKAGVDKKKLYKNKIDIIKLTFDSRFNDLTDERIIQSEIIRQIDKTINNSIGTFHEQILGGIKGYELGSKSGYDIKALDDTLFAEIKNKHNTMNSSTAESVFQKLASYADTYKKAKCYWVQILAKQSFCKLWAGEINRKEYSHSRVYKISGDQFYALLTGQDDAFYKLYRALPNAISDYLQLIKTKNEIVENSALSEIKKEIEETNRYLFDQIAFENYAYYLGFDKL